MLTNNFAAAINAREPLEISQDTAPVAVVDPGAQGNAFAGGRANADHEMYNAIHGAMMNGDTGGNSSIANAGMRLAAKFGSAASKSEKDAEKSRAAYIQVMSQQLQNMRNDLEAALNGMRERQGELEEQLDSLTRLRNLVNEGDFDPANADHLALYNSAFDDDPEMSAAEFVLQTQSEQNDVIDGTESDVEAERIVLEQSIAEVEEEKLLLESDDPSIELSIEDRVSRYEELILLSNEQVAKGQELSERDPPTDDAPQGDVALMNDFMNMGMS